MIADELSQRPVPAHVGRGRASTLRRLQHVLRQVIEHHLLRARRSLVEAYLAPRALDDRARLSRARSFIVLSEMPVRAQRLGRREFLKHGSITLLGGAIGAALSGRSATASDA